VLFMGVEIGLVAGVLLSIAFFIRASSRPNITQVGRLGETENFRSIKRHEVETLNHVLALRVDENIYFANALQIEDKFLKRVQRRRGTEHLLLVCSSINMIDATGLQMLHRVNSNLQTSGVTFNLCDVKGKIIPQLDASELTKNLTGQIFFNADRAMKHFSSLKSSHKKEAGTASDLHSQTLSPDVLGSVSRDASQGRSQSSNDVSNTPDANPR